MSITKCKHCDNDYDQDVDVEHEEVCKQEDKIYVKVSKKDVAKFKNILDDFSKWMETFKPLV